MRNNITDIAVDILGVAIRGATKSNLKKVGFFVAPLVMQKFIPLIVLYIASNGNPIITPEVANVINKIIDKQI